MFDSVFKILMLKHKANSFVSYIVNHISSNDSKEMIKSRQPVLNPSNLDSKEQMESFLSSFDTILCDCDGVLWINNDPVDGVPEALNKLRFKGKKIIFATNNSTKSREQFMEKLAKMGYIVNINELFPTSYSAASYLKSIEFKKKVYVVGSQGIADELAKVGIQSIGIGPDMTPEDWSPGMAPVKLDPDVGAVIVGFDNQISFPKLVKVCSYVSKHDCIFIAANEDESYPSIDPSIKVPGPGAYLAAINAVTGKSPIAVGKPHKYLFDCIVGQNSDIDPKRTVMIGDRLTTDMVFGAINGLKTLFVESGISTYDEMIKYRNSKTATEQIFVPNFYLKSLDVFNKYI